MLWCFKLFSVFSALYAVYDCWTHFSLNFSAHFKLLPNFAYAKQVLFNVKCKVIVSYIIACCNLWNVIVAPHRLPHQKLFFPAIENFYGWSIKQKQWCAKMESSNEGSSPLEIKTFLSKFFCFLMKLFLKCWRPRTMAKMKLVKKLAIMCSHFHVNWDFCY